MGALWPVAQGRRVEQRGGRDHVLGEHLEGLDPIRRAAGPNWSDHGLLFPRPDGTWWNPPAVTLAFIRAVKAAGVPEIRLHDLKAAELFDGLVFGPQPDEPENAPDTPEEDQ